MLYFAALMRVRLLALCLGCSVLLTAADDLESSVELMAKTGYCTAPSFSPDGKRIAFVSNMSGSPQIWMVGAGGGWPVQVTALNDPVGSISWSPDGNWIAFSVAPGGGMNAQVYLVRPDGTGMRRITAGGKETNNVGVWSHDGKWLAWTSNVKSGRSMDAYAYDVTTGESSHIADLKGVGGITDFSHDRKQVVLTRLRSRGSNDLYVRNLQTGAETLLTPHEGPGSFYIGVFSTDGSMVYLSSNKDRDRSAFGKVPVAGGPIQVIASREDAELQTAEITEDGKTAAVLWNVAGRSELQLMDVATSKLQPALKLPTELAGGLTWSRDGNLLALVASGSASVPNIWVYDRRSARMLQITDSPHAGIQLESLVRPELVKFSAHDGLELSGWLYKPRGVTGKAPFVLSFHGGPEGQEVPVFRASIRRCCRAGSVCLRRMFEGRQGSGRNSSISTMASCGSTGLRTLCPAWITW